MKRYLVLSITVAALALSPAVIVACGDDGGGDSDATGNDMSASDSPGSDTNMSADPPAPLTTNLSCDSLPAAVEGEDAINVRFYFDFESDLSCTQGEFGPPPAAGGQLELEYYNDPESDFSNAIAAWNRPFDGEDLKFVSCSSGEVLENFNGTEYGCSELPVGEDVTMTITDVATETRTIEIVFQIQAPWVAIMSVTEL